MTASASAAASTQQPRAIQSILLLVTSALSVLLTAVIGPSLPQMQQHFANVPNANYLVSMSITAPMLVMACLSIFFGAIADRLGRKRMLVWGTLLYTLFGSAPLWLDSLYAILASRVCIGFAEGILITCSTTMIGDYYSGPRREKFMALQTTVAACSAVLFNMLGGAIGEFGWRAPYSIYVLSILLMPLMQIYLWEPRKDQAVNEAEQPVTGRQEVKFRPKLLAGICLVTFFGAMAFLIVPVNLGFLFTAIGVEHPKEIGLAYSVNSIGVVAGTLAFGWLIGPRFRIAYQLAIAIGIAAIGFFLMGKATQPSALTIAAAINGLGCGMLLPTMTCWNMRHLPFAKRGVGTGAFMSSLYLGFFFSPLLIVYLAEHAGGRAVVVSWVGIAMLVIAACSLIIGVISRRSYPQPQALTNGPEF